MGLSSFIFVQWSPKDASSATECVLVVQGHRRSMILVPIESIRLPICPPILHSFRDRTIYWLKIAIFPTPLSFGALTPYVPFGILRWS